MADPFTFEFDGSQHVVHEAPRHGGYEIIDVSGSASQAPYLGVSMSRATFRWFGILLIGVVLLFAARASYLQLARGSFYRGIADGNRIRLERIPALRGLFFDRNNVPLVENVARFILAIQPSTLPKDEKTRAALFEKLITYDIFPVDIDTIIAENPRSGDWISVREPLTQAEAISLIADIKNIPGFAVHNEMRRQYVTDQSVSLSHMLGYLGRPTIKETSGKRPELRETIIGRTGLEKMYNQQLAGIDGTKQTEVDVLGHPAQSLLKQDAVPGSDLVLNIDLGLQKEAERLLREELHALGRTRGSVIAIDPRDGGVRALVSLPSFNANDFGPGLSKELYKKLSTDPDEPLFPRATSGAYPSGSVIKPVYAIAALAEGIITPQTSVNSIGGISIGQWTFPDWKTGGHGITNVYKAIAESVNTFFYYIGGGYEQFKGLGPDRMASWLHQFGFGSASGIDVPGEGVGFVPTPAWRESQGNLWYIGDTYHLAIGQGDFLTTPLQIALMTATIANGGIRYVPEIVHAIRNQKGDFTVIEPKITPGKPLPTAALAIVRDAMRDTVTSGVAQSLKTLPIEVAGKTGTAQWKEGRSTHAWFTGFGPFDHPELAITVMIEEGGQGSSTAVPIARGLFEWYASHTTKSQPSS